jgi:hypothetical protein
VAGNPADFDLADDPDPDVAELVDFDDCIITIPGSIGKNIIATDFDFISYWYAKFIETPSRQNAVIKYNALAAQLLAVPISTATAPKAKLIGKTEPPGEDGSATSIYTIDKPGPDLKGFKVWLSIHKKSNNMYVVSLRLGEME